MDTTADYAPMDCTITIMDTTIALPLCVAQCSLLLNSLLLVYLAGTTSARLLHDARINWESVMNHSLIWE